jgi:hypothetical protein
MHMIRHDDVRVNSERVSCGGRSKLVEEPQEIAFAAHDLLSIVTAQSDVARNTG